MRGKLTARQVREIRSVYRPRVTSLSTLAREYGVTPQAIHRIVKGQVWSNDREQLPDAVPIPDLHDAERALNKTVGRLLVEIGRLRRRVRRLAAAEALLKTVRDPQCAAGGQE